MTHIFATLEISPQAFDEIAKKMKDADYNHAFVDDVIDMHGIGLVRAVPELLGDTPEEGHVEMMNDAAGLLNKFFNGDKELADRETGFVLFVFPFEGGEERWDYIYYISNGADRKDVVIMMKEQVSRFEGQAELSGTG